MARKRKYKKSKKVGTKYKQIIHDLKKQKTKDMDRVRRRVKKIQQYELEDQILENSIIDYYNQTHPLNNNNISDSPGFIPEDDF